LEIINYDSKIYNVENLCTKFMLQILLTTNNVPAEYAIKVTTNIFKFLARTS
jgi:hypothetical protein